MTDPALIENILKYTGLAGLAIFATMTLFKSIIQKNIFSNMTKEQSFRIITLMIRGALFVAIVGIGAWVFTSWKSDKEKAKSLEKNKDILGLVVDVNGKPIQAVKGYLAIDDKISGSTDVDGNLYLPVNGIGEDRFEVILKHPSFKLARKWVPVNFKDDSKPSFRVELEYKEEIKPEPIVKKTKQTEDDSQTTAETKKKAFVFLEYTGDQLGCILDLAITIHDQTYYPTVNRIRVDNLPTGEVNYTITGAISCGYNGNCQVEGVGTINVISGKTYDVVWQNTQVGYCEMYLIMR